jgi:hypothetical protein
MFVVVYSDTFDDIEMLNFLNKILLDDKEDKNKDLLLMVDQDKDVLKLVVEFLSNKIIVDINIE